MEETKDQNNEIPKGVGVETEVIRASMADLEAMQMLLKLKKIPITTDFYNPTDAGNYIIALAEKIKAQRSVIAMHV